MILYRPTDGDVLTTPVSWRPKTCFLISQLSDPVPADVTAIRKKLITVMSRNDYAVMDANSLITGKDFLLKIWNLLVSCPLAVAIVTKDLTHSTCGNIFYEIGLAHALGKETAVIKTKDATVPTDFVRTEYINYSPKLGDNLQKYLDSLFEYAQYYEKIADQLDANPLLAMDYLRRAWLITGKTSIKRKTRQIASDMKFGVRAKNSVEMLSSDFAGT